MPSRRVVTSPDHINQFLIRVGGSQVAIIPNEDFALLNRFIEQERDRRDVEEAERRLADPAERPIPYEEAQRRLGLGDPSGSAIS